MMPTKGMTVTAAHQLVATLCGTRGVPLLVTHDFDKATFSIAATIQPTRGATASLTRSRTSILASGSQTCARSASKASPRRYAIKVCAKARARNLRLDGATEQEVEFLLDHRVELNALTSDQLVAFIERKLTEHGIRKIIPDQDLLDRTYEAAVRTAEVREVVERVLRDTTTSVTVSDDLRQQSRCCDGTTPSASLPKATTTTRRSARTMRADQADCRRESFWRWRTEGAGGFLGDSCVSGSG